MSFLYIQSSAVITWSNVVRYFINNYRNWGRISIRCWIYKRHHIPRPHGRVMGHLLWIFFEKIDCVITASHCIWTPNFVITQHKLKWYACFPPKFPWPLIDGLVQNRCNSSTLATELCLSYTNPSYRYHVIRMMQFKMAEETSRNIVSLQVLKIEYLFNGTNILSFPATQLPQVGQLTVALMASFGVLLLLLLIAGIILCLCEYQISADLENIWLLISALFHTFSWGVLKIWLKFHLNF